MIITFLLELLLFTIEPVGENLLQLMPQLSSLVLHLIVVAHQLNNRGRLQIRGEVFIFRQENVASHLVQELLRVGRVERTSDFQR